ncbi:conserved Plasmodium protein, unknown function [Plasmodium relictum]|uniref:CHY-type domain-containing protein n=1 Tax=Plasmodium relictum TaxID=85471 RepID=A0A1J1H7F7_PLARL|nr:conserved Plasmodium protein, unknown function [Plasmodium relictum]CRG99516.1 conserved Plasmodium protein, unknown function [Plasmodium relictum]
MKFNCGLKNNFAEKFQNLDENKKNDVNVLNSNGNNKNIFQKNNLKKNNKYMNYPNELNKNTSFEKKVSQFISNRKLNDISSSENKKNVFYNEKNVVDKKINKMYKTESIHCNNNPTVNCIKKKSYINECNDYKKTSNVKGEYKFNKFINKEKISCENSKNKKINNPHNFTEESNINDIKISKNMNNMSNTIDNTFNNSNNKNDNMNNRFKNSFVNINNINKNVCATNIYKDSDLKLNNYHNNLYKVNHKIHNTNNISYGNGNVNYFNSSNFNRKESFKKIQNTYNKNNDNRKIINDQNKYNETNKSNKNYNEKKNDNNNIDNKKYYSKNNEENSNKNTNIINKKSYFNKKYNNEYFYNYNLNKTSFNYNLKININKNNNHYVRYRKNEFNKTYCNENYLNKNFKNKNMGNLNINENNFSKNKSFISDNNINEKFEEHFKYKNNDSYIDEINRCNYIIESDISCTHNANILAFKKEKEINKIENECENTNKYEDTNINENKNNNAHSNKNEKISENRDNEKVENKDIKKNETEDKRIENDCNKKNEILNEENCDNMNEELKRKKREEEKKKIMNWKTEEQALLEEGLRVYKNLKNCPEKWIKISEIVKSKNPDDCLKRFLYCRSIVLKEKEKMKKEMEQMKEKEENEKNEYKEENNKEIKNSEELEQDIDSDDMNINNNINIKGKSLILNNVLLKNISMYKAVLLKLQLVCTRCCNTFEVISTTKDDSQLVCNCINCCNSAVIEIYRNICFLENSCICVLKFNQCSLMDLLTADYSMNCENCGRKIVFKNVTSGKEMNANCHNCFTKLEFKYKDFSFDDTINANNDTIKKIDEMINKLFTKKKSNKKVLSTSNNLKIEKCKNVMKINNIEVNNGACKHFKKSHRLFKFPCCNKVFPCPTCHDLNSNHECDIARRIICGFCYREFSDDEVCICQKEKKVKKSGKFWEGGKGCRNAITLSKNDSKKYKLLNRQTAQKKKKK